jgi:hypothetical protein
VRQEPAADRDSFVDGLRREDDGDIVQVVFGFGDCSDDTSGCG